MYTQINLLLARVYGETHVSYTHAALELLLHTITTTTTAPSSTTSYTVQTYDQSGKILSYKLLKQIYDKYLLHYAIISNLCVFIF